MTVFPDHGFRIDFPDHCSPRAQDRYDLLGRLRHDHGGGERRPAAAGHRAERDRTGIADQRLHFRIVNAEQFRRNVDHRGPVAANIRVSRDNDNRTVLVDVDLRARFTAGIEPVATRNTTPLIGPERCLVMLMRKRRFDRLLVAHLRIGRPISCNRAFLRRVLQSELKRVHADRFELLRRACTQPDRPRSARPAPDTPLPLAGCTPHRYRRHARS